MNPLALLDLTPSDWIGVAVLVLTGVTLAAHALFG